MCLATVVTIMLRINTNTTLKIKTFPFVILVSILAKRKQRGRKLGIVDMMHCHVETLLAIIVTANIFML